VALGSGKDEHIFRVASSICLIVLASHTPTQPSAFGAKTMSRLSFETLPVEIQNEIYSYLLVDRNVVYVNALAGRKLRLKFEVALFRVSRPISIESLRFFYSKNAFVVIRSNVPHLLSTCHLVMPMLVGPAAPSIERFALGISLVQENNWMELRTPLSTARRFRHGSAPKTPEGYEWSPTVITAPELPKFILIMNDLLSDSAFTSLTTLTVMSISFQTSKSKVYPWVTSLLIANLSGICTSNLIEDYVSDNGGTLESNPLKVQILGDLSQADYKTLKSSQVSTPETLVESISKVAALFKQGNLAFEQDDLVEAHQNYTLAHFMSTTFITRVKRDRNLKQQLMINRVVDLDVRNSLAMAKVNKRLGLDLDEHSLLSRAASILDLYKDSVDSNLAVNLHLFWGSTLADDEKYEDTLTHLYKANQYAPSATILTKIKQVATLLAQVPASQEEKENRRRRGSPIQSVKQKLKSIMARTEPPFC